MVDLNRRGFLGMAAFATTQVKAIGTAAAEHVTGLMGSGKLNAGLSSIASVGTDYACEDESTGSHGPKLNSKKYFTESEWQKFLDEKFDGELPPAILLDLRDDAAREMRKISMHLPIPLRSLGHSARERYLLKRYVDTAIRQKVATMRSRDAQDGWADLLDTIQKWAP